MCGCVLNYFMNQIKYSFDMSKFGLGKHDHMKVYQVQMLAFRSILNITKESRLKTQLTITFLLGHAWIPKLKF
jgi:hypothetical protein